MYMKLPPEDLNPNLCPLHHISVYTCEVTITPWCAVVNKKEKKKKINLKLAILCVHELVRVGLGEPATNYCAHFWVDSWISGRLPGQDD